MRKGSSALTLKPLLLKITDSTAEGFRHPHINKDDTHVHHSVIPTKDMNIVPIHPAVRYREKLDYLYLEYAKEARERITNLINRKIREQDASRKSELKREARLLSNVRLQELYNRGQFSYTAALSGLAAFEKREYTPESRLKPVLDLRNKIIGYDSTIPSVARDLKEMDNLKQAEQASLSKLTLLAQFFHLSSDFVTKSNLERKIDSMFSAPPRIAAEVSVSQPPSPDDNP